MNYSIILKYMRNIDFFVLILALFLFVSCAATHQHPEPIERVQLHMGTYGRVLIYGGSNEDIDAAFAKIAELDELLSDYNPNSHISEINDNAGISPLAVDPQVVELLEIAKNVASQTQGVFDPTIGALTIGVYRFGRESDIEVNQEDIDKAKSLVNYRDLIIDENTVYLKRKGMMIDLGGIGKGYAVENAVKVLKERGVESGVVSLSGDFKAFGDQIDIAIQNPEGEGAIASFRTAADDIAISTSGSYERSVMIDGEVYHHLIVPQTGQPGHDFLSLTVVMDGSSTLADAYATALFIMGWEKASAFLDNHKGIGVFVVFPDKNIYYNKEFSDFVSELRIKDNPSE